MAKQIKKKLKRHGRLFFKAIRRTGDLVGLLLLLAALIFALRFV
ncbi:MAG: hypothetical protein ACOC12_06630 [Bacteroidota bacterium]